MILTLDVIGTPQPKGSKTAFVRGGRAVLVDGRRPEARQKVSSWREAIAHEARVVCRKLESGLVAFPEGAVRVTCAFRLPKPKSARKSNTLPAKKPDADKLARLALDELTGIVWRDDSQVCELLVTKVYATGIPGATITIEPLVSAS